MPYTMDMFMIRKDENNRKCSGLMFGGVRVGSLSNQNIYILILTNLILVEIKKVSTINAKGCKCDLALTMRCDNPHDEDIVEYLILVRIR